MPRRAVAVTPCRYGSTRFPGKPLAMLAGMPLLLHVYQRCLSAERIDETVIATDDERIADVCTRPGIPYRMTGEHPTPPERIGWPSVPRSWRPTSSSMSKATNPSSRRPPSRRSLPYS
ncbi:hypothetical protein G6048_39775 [Streptomyces sp. YC419]|uniref:3-deoxy-manno-octulosonate cytidylyltransferase n=1 Tax=Streptomyces ureilyticus TaxID=1775131 RepID=A0ABX0E190_9ACTN|nr:hypothetical protein [Streptomyces ureilyticus]